MSRLKLICAVLGAAFAVVFQLAPAQAQNATSYVSRNGSDANFCQNATTQVCRFLDTAYDQTNPRGKIIILDSGTFAGSGLVITQAISIVAQGVQAQLAGSGVQTKIIVNAGPNDVVYLDGLSIVGEHGASEPDGIVFNSGAQLHIRNCSIHGFNGAGIRIQAPGSSEVIISNCKIYDNAFGVWAKRNGGSGALGVLIDNTTITDNANVGIKGTGAQTHIRINESKIVRNTTGLVSQNARLISFGNNIIERNGTNGAPTHTDSFK